MAELPILPKEIQGLGKLISFGNPDRGIKGTQFYLKPEAMEKYKDHKFSDKHLEKFTMFDGQSAKDKGVDSARIKMTTDPTDKKDAATEIRSNPSTGEQVPLKNAWGVRLIDDTAQFVDIPIGDLTTRKPKDQTKPLKEPLPQPKTSSRKELEKILTGSADATTTTQDTVPGGSDDGIDEGILVHNGGAAEVPLPIPADVPADNISMADDGMTTGILGHDGNLPTTPEPSPTMPPEPVPVVSPPNPDTPPPSPTPDVPPTIPSPPVPETPRENVVTIVGIQEAFKRRATDWAKESMEKSRNIIKKFFGERFEEKYYQHYHKMLEAAQNPFVKESVVIAQERAQARYEAEMNGRNRLSRAARRTWDRLKEYTFGSTTLERYAIEEIAVMQRDGQLREQTTFNSEMQEFVKRFEVPFEESDIAIRKQLGEKLEILSPDNAEHKPLIDGIKGLIKEYRDGTIPDATILNDRLHTLYETTISPGRKDLFGEAETYASSLAVVAKEMKNRLEHGVSLGALDAELEAMQVRLGIGQMGEATEITPTSTHKVVEWINRTASTLEKRGIIQNVVINEYTVGSAVSAILALKTIPQAAMSGVARMWTGGIGGAAVTGVIAGRREFGRRQGELRRVGAQKEAGIRTPDSATQRQWYESFNFQLRSTTDLINSMQSPIFDAQGALKPILTIDELRLSSANLADAKARSALSQRERNRFGLIMVGAVGEQETNRTALASSMIKTETNLKTYLESHRQDQTVIDLIGPTRTVEQYLDTLTSTQTRILTEGNDVLANLNDSYMKIALTPLSSYTPEADVMRRQLGIFGARQSRGTESGMDAVLKEFRTQAGVESARVGIRSGTIGLAMGAITNEAVMDLKAHEWGHGAISGLFMHQPDAGETLSSIPPITHVETIGDQQIMLGENMHIDETGNLDIFDGAGHKINDAIPNFSDHYHNGVLDDFAKDKLHELGLDSSLTVSEVTQTIPGTATETPGITEHFQGGQEFTDANGVVHTPEWTLPTGTHLTAVPGDAQTFNLIDTDGTMIAQGIHTDATGAITNMAEIQNQLPEGWTVLDATTAIQHTPETILDPTTRSVHVFTDWDNRGHWGWTEKQLAGEDIAHLNPAVNTITNIWRSYENQIQGENITFDHTIPGLEDVHRSIPLVNGEVSANIMPNNSIIELPNSLFSDTNMAQLAKWSDEGIKMLDAEQLAHPEMTPMQILAEIQKTDKLHGLILRIGRFAVPAIGQDKVSAEELQFLMRELAGDHQEATETLLHNITFTESIAEPVTKTVQEHLFTVTEQMTKSPEGFIPILPSEIRKGLEPVDIPTVTPPIVTPPITPPVTPPEPPPTPEKGDNNVEKGDTFRSTSRVGTPPIVMPPPPPPKISESEERKRKKKEPNIPVEPQTEETLSPPIIIKPAVSEQTAPKATIEETTEEEPAVETPPEQTIPINTTSNITPHQEEETIASEPNTEIPAPEQPSQVNQATPIPEESLANTVNVPTVEQNSETQTENRADKPPAGHDVDIPIDQDLQQLVNELNGQI